MLEGNLISGLLVNDISDHLPIFVVYDQTYEGKEMQNTTINTRIKSEVYINRFKSSLQEEKWEEVLKATDVNSAYSSFLQTFTKLFDKHCPMRVLKLKNQSRENRPWMTKTLINACRKKNTLYRQFLKNRAPDSENKYKLYKNKLTSILREKKKEYYIFFRYSSA